VKKLTALLIAVVAIPVAYTAAAWFIGMDVQAQIESREQDVLSNAPYLELTHHQYERGIFSATEQSTYAFRAQLPGVALSGRGGASPLQLTIRNVIYHGPLPGFRRIGLAAIDTQLVPPPELARALDSVFAGQPAVTIQTRMGWLGGVTTVFSSPAFHVPLPTGGTLSWRGLSGSFTSTRGRATWSAHVASQGFKVEGPRGRADLGEIGFDATMRRAFDVIYVGDSDLKLARADIDGGNGSDFQLTGLSIRGTSAADGQFVDIGVDMSADQAKTQKLSFSKAVYSLRLSHLHGDSLASLTRALRQVRANSAPAAVTAAPSAAATRDAFNQYGVEILVRDPVVEIPRMGFAMPEGEFQLSAKLAAHDIKREDLSGPAGFMALAPHLEAAVDVRMDAALLEKLMASDPSADQHSAQLAKLEQQGLIKRTGGTLTLQLSYRAGKLTINGQPYPPAGP
jgi:uncharacterized protein YdgA (DUF945 family)